MRCFSLLVCLCLLFLSFGLKCYALQAQADQPTYAVNFNYQQNPDQVVYFRDLELWARSRNLILLPDLPLGGMQDFEGLAIPSYGHAFDLSSPRPSRVFLVLDLATYQPQKKLASEWGKVDWLEIKVNGHSVGMLSQGRGSFLPYPVVLTIEQEWLDRQRLHVFMQPSPRKSRAFVLWDAFVSKEPPNPKALYGPSHLGFPSGRYQ